MQWRFGERSETRVDCGSPAAPDERLQWLDQQRSFGSGLLEDDAWEMAAPTRRVGQPPGCLMSVATTCSFEYFQNIYLLWRTQQVAFS